jgi:putative transposase
LTESDVFELAKPGPFRDLLTEVLRPERRPSKPRLLKTEVGRQHVVRHGHLPERAIMAGVGAVAARQPRVYGREATDGGHVRFRPLILPPSGRV